MQVVERPSPGMGTQTLTFFRHFLEMCMAMCVGFVIGDIAYFWVTGLFGYSSPFSQLPELSVLVVAFAMTAPMAAWMLFRGMARRPTAEMSAAMVIWAFLVLGVGWAGFLPMSSLAVVEHGLMMPAMLVPMFLRLDLYTGRTGHHMGHGQHAP
jgi:hypothetical protein